MKKLAYIFTLVFIIISASIPSFAAPPKWDLDPAHSGFYFGITHIYSEVKGFFGEYSGNLYFDPNNLNESRFEFTVAVKSVDTNNNKRDGHLVSADFFDAKKFPTMTFKSQSIKHVKGDQYSVDGVLTIKDVSKNISVPFTYFGTKDNPFNPKIAVAGFEARMDIDRLNYNVGNGKFFKMGVVGKDVDVLISLEVTRKK